MRHRIWPKGPNTSIPSRNLEKELLARLAAAVIAEDRQLVISLVIALSNLQDTPYCREALETLAKCLETDDWEAMSKVFTDPGMFFGSDGKFLMVGNYSIRRNGSVSTELTLMAGRARMDLVEINGRALYDYFDSVDIHSKSTGDLFAHPVPVIFPIELDSFAGPVGNESGEAFVVPDGWEQIPNAEAGHVFNIMAEQRRRFRESGETALRRILTTETADLVLGLLGTGEVEDRHRALEYQTHDIGHSTGLGLHQKLHDNLLGSPRHRGVEEFRADGIGLSLVKPLMSKGQFAGICASNFATRFGVDAHRRGGISLDTDMIAVALLFKTAFESGLFHIQNRKIGFANPTPESLIALYQASSEKALAITRQELNLARPEGIQFLYEQLASTVLPSEQDLFQILVTEPCQGIFGDLQ